MKDFKPDFVVYNASKAKVENYKELGLNSETAAMFNITSREQVIREYMVRRRDEERYVLYDELLSAA